MQPKMEIIEPFSIYVDNTVSHFFPKWWHRFIFWKKFKYHSFIQRTKKVSIKDLEAK